MIGFTYSGISDSRNSGHANFPIGCLSLITSGVVEPCDSGIMSSRHEICASVQSQTSLATSLI